MKGHAVYALCEPGSGEVRYIGYSKNARGRYRGHLRDTSATHKAHWVNKLLREGVAPKLRILCVTQDAAEAKRVEVGLIAAYRRSGARLTNSTDGGDGGSGMEWTAEMRAKVSAASKGRVPSVETRAKISAAHTGMVRPAGTGSKISAALTGRKLSEEHRRKIRVIKSNPSVETRAKLSLARKGKKLSHEHRAKIAEAQKHRKPDSADTRAKKSAANRGRVHSAEVRANMSAAHKGKKLSPESIAKRTATNKAIGRKWTPEQKAMAAAATRAAWERDPGRRAKQSELSIRVHTGRTLTDEAKKKISAANKGRKLSADARANMRAAWVIRRGAKCV